MKLIFLSVLILSATARNSLASSGDVHVKESCDRYGCVISIVGEKSSCLEAARARNWSSGFEAAVSIRNCLDKAQAEKVASK